MAAPAAIGCDAAEPPSVQTYVSVAQQKRYLLACLSILPEPYAALDTNRCEPHCITQALPHQPWCPTHHAR